MNLDRVIAVRNDKTVFRDGNRCIKVFGAQYSKSDVLNEALNQARIEETGLLIPKVIEVTKIEGKWTIVSEYIKGKTLARLIDEQPERKEEYTALLVSLQMSVHEKIAPLLPKLNDKLKRKLADTELAAAVNRDLYTRLEGMPRHLKVCHGDFVPSNVIITEDGTPYILDWSHVTQGNASADVARTYLHFLLKSDVSTAELYLDLYCQKSGTAKNYVQKWIPIIAAVQSVTANARERKLLLSLASANYL